LTPIPPLQRQSVDKVVQRIRGAALWVSIMQLAS
jgi:hypothetical protein